MAVLAHFGAVCLAFLFLLKLFVKYHWLTLSSDWSDGVKEFCTTAALTNDRFIINIHVLTHYRIQRLVKKWYP